MNDVLGRLRKYAQLAPESVAFRFISEDAGERRVREWTYGELLPWVQPLAWRLAGYRGERGLLLLTSDDSMVRAFLACLYAGVIAVPIQLNHQSDATSALRRSRRIVEDSAPAVVLTTTAIAEELRNVEFAGVCEVLCVDRPDAEGPRSGGATPHEVAFLQYTSGSTGIPKGVCNTHAALLKQADGLAAVWLWEERMHSVTWLPLYHDMGLIFGLLGPLLNGGTCTLMRPQDFVARPGFWLEIASQYRATMVAAPDSAYAMCCERTSEQERAALDLSQIRYAINGAEPIRPDTVRRFTEDFADAGLDVAAMTPGYGLAEACLAVSVSAHPRGGPYSEPRGWKERSYDSEGLSEGVAKPPKSAGRVLVGSGNFHNSWSLAIVDPETCQLLEDRRIGEVWVSGPGLPTGYWNRPDETEATFGARLTGQEGAYLRTGDLGFLDEGELFICGRLKDLIIYNGVNHHPNDLESTVERLVPEVGVGSVCAIQTGARGEGSIVIILGTKPASKVELDDLGRRVSRAVLIENSVPVSSVVMIPRARLARTSSGKIQRLRMCQLLDSGSLEVLHIYESDSEGAQVTCKEDLRRAVAALLTCVPSAIRHDSDLLALGMTSAQMVEIAAVLSRSGFRVRFSELLASPSISSWWSLATSGFDESGIGIGFDDPVAPFELTPLQQAYLSGRNPALTLGGVGCSVYLEFEAEGVVESRLENAFRSVLRRHDMLRCRVLADGTQCVEPESSWPGMAIHAFAEMSPSEAEEALMRVRADLSHRMFEATSGHVIDLQLSRLPGGQSRIHFGCDLLVADALSVQIILDELAHFYADQDGELDPLGLTFAQYLRAQKSDSSEDRTYWESRIRDIPDAPQLALACSPESVTPPRFFRHEGNLTEEEWLGVQRAAGRAGATPSVAIAACFAHVLKRWCTESVFTLNLTLFDRNWVHPDVGRVVGDFTSTVLLAVDASGSPSISELAARIQAQLVADLPHAGYSGVEVVRDLRRARDEPYWMAPVVFTSKLGRKPNAGGAIAIFGRPVWSVSQTPQVWLDHQLNELDEGVWVTWDVVEGLFPAGLIESMFDAYMRMLRWLSRGDMTKPLPGLVDDQLAIREAHQRPAHDTGDLTLLSGFVRAAARTPDAVALIDCDDRATSYCELLSLAMRWAARLQELGVHKGDLIAVSLPRGRDQIAAVLAVLASGATYVPVSRNQPVLRRQQICAQAGVGLVIDSSPDLADRRPLDQPVPVSPDDPAYVIFTSGSTGAPKGVEITHRACLNTICEINSRLRLSPGDRILGVSALDFDLSVYDIFGPLHAGATLVLVSDQDNRDAVAWIERVKQHDITVWNSAPVLVEMALTAAEAMQSSPSSLRAMLVSGDWVGLDLAPRLRALVPTCRFMALGGATEAAIWSNCYDVESIDPDWVSVPYGFPLAGQILRVVDRDGVDRPDWVPGELWIGGAGLANGYINAPSLTTESFLQLPGGRWYRTGDEGRFLPDGTIEFLGRKDQQVKVRGHRIELGEVEAAAQSHPLVSQAVAIASGERGHRSILAAVTLKPGADSPPPRRLQEDLADFLAKRLPAYSIPTRLMVVDAFPLTLNGKIDRRALEQRMCIAISPTDAEDAPTEELEIAVAKKWEDQFGVPVVSRSADFFQLGGDSLHATKLVAEVRESFGVNLPLWELLEEPTVSGVASAIRRHLGHVHVAFEEGRL